MRRALASLAAGVCLMAVSSAAASADGASLVVTPSQVVLGGQTFVSPWVTFTFPVVPATCSPQFPCPGAVICPGSSYTWDGADLPAFAGQPRLTGTSTCVSTWALDPPAGGRGAGPHTLCGLTQDRSHPASTACATVTIIVTQPPTLPPAPVAPPAQPTTAPVSVRPPGPPSAPVATDASPTPDPPPPTAAPTDSAGPPPVDAPSPAPTAAVVAAAAVRPRLSPELPLVLAGAAAGILAVALGLLAIRRTARRRRPAGPGPE
jgi:hypothetical protein